MLGQRIKQIGVLVEQYHIDIAGLGHKQVDAERSAGGSAYRGDVIDQLIGGAITTGDETQTARLRHRCCQRWGAGSARHRGAEQRDG
nr:hypothetical protein CPGR_06038 [Mycolicibacter nonchromogenicus]